MEDERVTAAEVGRLLGSGSQWRYLLGTLQATFTADSFPDATAFGAAVGAAAEAAGHHPDIDIRYPDRVHVSLTTHHVGGVTTHDTELAKRIDAVAAATDVHPIAASTGTSQATELCIDTMDADVIRPFWAAAFAYDTAPDGALVDPRRQGWSIWFQQMDEPRTERNRFHIDISVAHDVADARIAAALAAGGTMVSDGRARAFWILADADGNEACICTWQDRD